jgi:hypothetical protein
MTAGSTEGPCRVCAADIPAGALVCPRCGASQRMEVCPLCGATAGISRDDEMRFRCDVCGGPRVPLDTKGLRRSGKEVAALRRADDARKARAKNRAGAVAAGLSVAGALGVIALVGLLGVLGVVELGLGAPALDAAWMSVAADVAEQSRVPITARSLAEALRVEEPQAEELLALLEAHDVLRADGKLTQASRLRIDTPAPSATTEAAEAEAEAQAEAEAEIERHVPGARDKQR